MLEAGLPHEQAVVIGPLDQRDVFTKGTGDLVDTGQRRVDRDHPLPFERRRGEIQPVEHGVSRPGAAPDPTSRAGRSDKRMVETEFRQESLVIAQTLGKHAQARGVTLAQFATAWVLANGIVSSVIAGPRTLAQWQDYFPAVEFRLDADDEALVDSLVPSGHPSTPGFTDPAYPLIGRKASHQA